jgi:predicted transcriptional regulator
MQPPQKIEAKRMTGTSDFRLIEMTTDIVSAYVTQNKVSATEIGDLISTTYAVLRSLENAPAPEMAKDLVPAVPAKKSVFPDYIICLEDGKRFKSLKRHLRSSYDMTPEAYRAKWNLPADYPMVAPNYAAARSVLAKKIGLGRGNR